MTVTTADPPDETLVSDEHPNGIVPSTRKRRVGVRGGVTAQALQWVWDRLSRTEFRDAMALADEAAREFNIKSVSVRSYVYELVAEGHLLRKDVHRPVQVLRHGKRFESRRKFANHRISAHGERSAVRASEAAKACEAADVAEATESAPAASE